MSYETIITPLIEQLDGGQRRAASQSLERLLDAICKRIRGHGPTFGVTMRDLARDSDLNLKRVNKWIDRLVNAGHLAIVFQGSKETWGHRSSVYCAGGTLLYYATRATPTGLQGRLSKVNSGDSVSQVHEDTLLDEPSMCMDEFPCNCAAVAQDRPEASIRCSVPPVAFYSKWDALLADLPDLSETWDGSAIAERVKQDRERLIAKLYYLTTDEYVKRWEKEQRARERKYRASLGQHFVDTLWRQVQHEKDEGGKYQYPIHPDVYSYLKLIDAATAKTNPAYLTAADAEIERYNEEMRAMLYEDGEDLPLTKEYKYLFQPPKETRLKCPRCKWEGHRRTCRLIFLTGVYRRGAIKYYCEHCHWTWDIWRDFPVWGGRSEYTPFTDDSIDLTRLSDDDYEQLKEEHFERMLECEEQDRRRRRDKEEMRLEREYQAKMQAQRMTYPC